MLLTRCRPPRLSNASEELFSYAHDAWDVCVSLPGESLLLCVTGVLRRPQQRGMPEADTRWLFQQLLVAVEYCHLLGIANRDVKVCLAACSAVTPYMV